MKETFNVMKDYKVRKNILQTALVFDFLGICLMLFNHFIYGKEFWNSTTQGLLFGVLFILTLYKVCLKKGKS